MYWPEENMTSCPSNPDGKHEWIPDSAYYHPDDYSSPFEAQLHSKCKHCGTPMYPDYESQLIENMIITSRHLTEKKKQGISGSAINKIVTRFRGRKGDVD